MFVVTHGPEGSKARNEPPPGANLNSWIRSCVDYCVDNNILVYGDFNGSPLLITPDLFGKDWPRDEMYGWGRDLYERARKECQLSHAQQKADRLFAIPGIHEAVQQWQLAETLLNLSQDNANRYAGEYISQEGMKELTTHLKRRHPITKLRDPGLDGYP